MGDDGEVVGWALTGVPDGCELGDAGLHRDGFVALAGAFLEPSEVSRRGPFPLGVARKEEEVAGVAAGERRLQVGLADDDRHLVDAAATARPSPGEDHPSDQLGLLQGDHLGDSAAEGEPEEIDLFQAHGADEGDGIGAHLLDRAGNLRAAPADTAVVERNHSVVFGDAVHDARIPVIEDGGQMVAEHHRNPR